MEEFEWYQREVKTREAQIKIYQDLMIHVEKVTDYWWYLNRINELKNELYVLEEMAHEKGIYIV